MLILPQLFVPVIFPRWTGAHLNNLCLTHAPSSWHMAGTQQLLGSVIDVALVLCFCSAGELLVSFVQC